MPAIANEHRPNGIYFTGHHWNRTKSVDQGRCLLSGNVSCRYISIRLARCFLAFEDSRPMKKTKPGTGHNTRDVRLQKNYCFGCGRNNPDGMRLKFAFDEKRNCFVCRFRLDKRFTGPPGHCHGGIIATILDEALGKVNKLRDVVALTSEITVNYIHPVPLHKPLRVESREVRVQGRRHVNEGEILDKNGEVLARGRATFIAIDPHRMFAKFVEK